jgi:hypothetical protein
MTAGDIPYELLMEDKGKRKEKNHLADKYQEWFGIRKNRDFAPSLLTIT